MVQFLQSLFMTLGGCQHGAVSVITFYHTIASFISTSGILSTARSFHVCHLGYIRESQSMNYEVLADFSVLLLFIVQRNQEEMGNQQVRKDTQATIIWWLLTPSIVTKSSSAGCKMLCHLKIHPKLKLWFSLMS